MENSHTLVFIFCILAMLPLVKLHELATRELVIRIGGSRTGLLNASMANTVELVVATTALRKCELRVVQSSLIGGMLSKLLLVLGMCFFAGGIRFSEQDFDPTATGIQSSLLSISVGAVLLPAAYHFSLSGGTNSASNEQKTDILRMSHGVAIILLFIYIAYLLFQLWSHTHLFQDKKRPNSLLPLKPTKMMHSRSSTGGSNLEKDKSSPIYESGQDASPASVKSSASLVSVNHHRNPYSSGSPFASASDLSLPMTNASSSSSTTIGFVYSKAAPAPAINSTVKLVHDGRHGHTCPATELPSSTGPDFSPERPLPMDEATYIERLEEREAEKEEQAIVHHKVKEPKLSWPLTVGLLVIIAVLVAINAEWLVESMNGLSTETISKEWIALILLPTVSCIAECVTAINVSVKDQLTLSISVAVGSTIQTALFVIPFMIVLGWILDKPLAMLFDPFESVVLYISVHVMGYVVADGKSNWLEGVILICLYIIIAVSFWFYPGSTFSSTLAVCSTDPRA
ncbi:hypothetical protein DENSPDRAFT_251044 [Dentipellis sp. KUC8613]|nr:hypothetical protein DENSPDRAFT_251044 [Dentipellis sp. KUC8613]